MYVYEKASPTGPYTRPAGSYTRFGDVLPLLTSLDDKLVVFGSGDEVQLWISIPRNFPRYRKAGCAIIFSTPTAMRKTWTSTPTTSPNHVDPIPFSTMNMKIIPRTIFNPSPSMTRI